MQKVGNFLSGKTHLENREKLYLFSKTKKKQGARFCKWRTTVSIPAGPTNIALQDAAYGLARYATISQGEFFLPFSLFGGSASGSNIDGENSKEKKLHSLFFPFSL